MEEQKGLRQMLINRLESERGLPTKMAKLAGYSSSGALMKVLRKVDGDIEKFDGFVRIVHELFPEDKFDLMFEFAKSLNPNRMTARFMIEYAALYGLRDMKIELINKLADSDNDESKDWAFVYNIDHKLIVEEIGGFEAINQLSQRKYVSPEMKVYGKIVQFYSFYDMRNINMMTTLYNDIQVDIEDIKNNFTKSSYYTRLMLIETSVDLHSETISRVKEKLFFVDACLDPLKAYAYLQIGNSYMMTNYEKARDLFLRAMECSSESTKVQIKRSFNFLSILWDKFDEYESDGSLSNELFFQAKQGLKDLAIETLNKIDIEALSDQEKGFNYYYQGILFSDTNMFYQSIKYFNQCGEKFYKQLPLTELESRGVNKFILEALSA
ncbi:AimR family lysis-lysogeny pheromone receptor [Bacillus sp. AG4(2022)]|uniref:AimR family lysis-lysogeny pheromone receptor n=1 Tax=Bacillus sp. AG4(2022) TaxID=2962594 RepID=UPI002881A6B9|nr:AimR family lysis-lysogeny pheromone receptor [Bacillus sp. AG4(2022)]MDT0160371.1 AimR family lysis-lysogeny pheromone receptor [Bacillus sp. AG4(2022)]